jgi:alpha-tubulin suppressor-like RCC1 family protein
MKRRLRHACVDSLRALAHFSRRSDMTAGWLGSAIRRAATIGAPLYLLWACGGSDPQIAPAVTAPLPAPAPAPAAPPPAPSISLQPVDVTVVAGQPATFTAGASIAPAEPLTYQWSRRASAAASFATVSGATAASYTLAGTTVADSGAQFRVEACAGTTRCVTSNPVTLTVTPAPFSAPWQADARIAGGGTHTLLVRASGELFSWGANNGGALGRSNASAVNAPSAVTTLGTTVRSVAAGAWYSVALQTNGTVWAWGDGDRVGAAVGAAGAIQLPLQVTALSNVRAISTRYWHTLALRDDGTVWGFGPEQFSALGPITGSGAARQIPAVANARQVAAGEQHSLVLLADGTVRSFGSNTFGQLGLDTGSAPRTAPQTVPISDVVAIAASSFASFALRGDGTLWRWGNFAGTSNTAPAQVPFTGTLTQIAAGNQTLHALRSDGIPFGFGDNQFGRVGIGVTGGTLPDLRQIGVVGTASELAGGEFHAMALRNDGRVFTWGNNGNRQLNGAAGPDANVPQDAGLTR